VCDRNHETHDQVLKHHDESAIEWMTFNPLYILGKHGQAH
jgi:hypothetical protein